MHEIGALCLAIYWFINSFFLLPLAILYHGAIKVPWLYKWARDGLYHSNIYKHTTCVPRWSKFPRRFNVEHPWCACGDASIARCNFFCKSVSFSETGTNYFILLSIHGGSYLSQMIISWGMNSPLSVTKRYHLIHIITEKSSFPVKIVNCPFN